MAFRKFFKFQVHVVFFYIQYSINILIINMHEAKVQIRQRNRLVLPLTISTLNITQMNSFIFEKQRSGRVVSAPSF